MMIRIEEATTKKQLRTFVKLPFSLYKGSPYWVPPIINEELNTFNKDVNPAFIDADVKFFLAYKDDQLAGRVAAIINWIEVDHQKIRKMRFGWFDFIDDIEVSKALLEKVVAIGREHHLEYMEGPVGFTNLDKVGVLIEGFDAVGTMITWYNHPYYQKHFEEFGMTTEKEYVENRFPFSNAKPKFFMKASALIKRRYGVKSLAFTKTKDIMPWADKMFDLFNLTYAKLASFVPMTDIQKEYFKNKYISFINPEYIKFVLDKEDQLIAFAIVMPSFSKALQKAKGKLWPLGFMHLLNAKKNSKDVIFYLIGIHPEYQNKGVTAVIFEEYHRTFTDKKIETCIRTPELADNIAIRQIWKNFDPVIFKRRRTYKKVL